ncbi:hypothetical protein ABZP36_025687 [Zizania latifolia]
MEVGKYGVGCKLCGGVAAVHCVADNAFLCMCCDAKVHGANFLASRHRRRRLGVVEEEDDAQLTASSSCVSTTDSTSSTVKSTAEVMTRGCKRRASQAKAVLEGWAKRMGFSSHARQGGEGGAAGTGRRARADERWSNRAREIYVMVFYITSNELYDRTIAASTAITLPPPLPDQIVDPYLASYGVENPIFAVIQLAQTTMRSELGKITLDKTFEERDTLNEKIVRSINEAATDWGLKCLRYEIRDISPPRGVKVAMEMQAEAERKKRAQILESEGAMLDQANRAKGEAEAILAKSEATARGIRLVSEAMRTKGSTEAANLRVAEQYMKAFANLAKKTNTILLPSDAGNPSSLIAQSLQIYKHICQSNSLKSGSSPVEEPESEEEEIDSADLPYMSSGMPLPDMPGDHDKTFSLQRHNKDKR